MKQTFNARASDDNLHRDNAAERVMRGVQWALNKCVRLFYRITRRTL